MVTGVSAVLHSSTTHSPARQYGGALVVRQTLILLSLGVSSHITVDIYIFVDLLVGVIYGLKLGALDILGISIRHQRTPAHSNSAAARILHRLNRSWHLLDVQYWKNRLK